MHSVTNKQTDRETDRQTDRQTTSRQQYNRQKHEVIATAILWDKFNQCRRLQESEAIDSVEVDRGLNTF